MTNDLKISRDMAERILAYGWLLRGSGIDLRGSDRGELRALLAAPQCSEVSAKCSEQLRIQGEPVALYKRCTILNECNLRSASTSEQPAPVAVVLPEKLPDDDNADQSPDYDEGWNACLDKVKELNP